MTSLSHSIKRGSAELAILMVLKDQPLHGYEIARRIEQDTAGVLHFTLASLYPLLYRMEKRGWTRGAGERTSGGGKGRCSSLNAAGLRRGAAPPRAGGVDFGGRHGVGGVSAD